MTAQSEIDNLYQASKTLAKSQALRVRIWQRLFACGFYYSGLAKKFYFKSVEQQQTPWRILRYQHVVVSEDYPIQLEYHQYVHPKTFEENIRFLRDNFKIVPLKSLLDDVEAGKQIDPLTVCITIDKGWADTYSYAFPILYTYRVPATIFVAPAFIGSTELFWEEHVKLIMNALRNSNASFPKLTSLSRMFYEDLMQFSPNLEITDDAIALFIFLLTQAPLDKRQAVYLEFLDFAKAFGELPKIEPYISWKEAYEMQNSGLITFGSHGFSHKSLFELSREELADDVRMGFLKLREQNINFHQVLAIPDDTYTSSLITMLGDFGLRYAMSYFSEVDIDPRKHGTLLFGRVSVFENIANCKEIFACRILGNQDSQVRYIRRVSK